MEEKINLENISDESEGQLTVDVYETPNEIVVESTIAGVNSEDLDIDVSNESVTIKGERRRTEEVKEESYFYQECFWGKFSRSIILPQEVDPDNAQSSLKNGILTIKMPKLSRERTRKMTISTE